MPLFRSQPSRNLMSSVQRLVASGGGKLTPLAEMQADMAAAKTARDMSLAEKARVEAEHARKIEQQRTDPATLTDFASNAAGMDTPSGTRLMAHLRGALEEPGPSDYEDNPNVQPYPVQPPNLEPGQRGKFQNALTAAAANLLASGKTNANQLMQAAGGAQDLMLADEASRAPDAETGNRLVAAMTGKLRYPSQTNAQGVVTNRETGTTDESTRLARSVRDLNAARVGTEGARQTELGARTTRNTATANLQDARRGAVNRGETGRGGQRVSPQQVERWISEVARKEWELIPPRERKGMNFQQHVEKVRERFNRGGAGTSAAQDIQDAYDSIGKGAPADAVRRRFKERNGFDLPSKPAILSRADTDNDTEPDDDEDEA